MASRLRGVGHIDTEEGCLDPGVLGQSNPMEDLLSEVRALRLLISAALYAPEPSMRWMSSGVRGGPGIGAAVGAKGIGMAW